MTNVNVGFGVSDPTHDLSISDGVTTLGLIYAGGPRVLQEIPLSPPAQQFENEQRNWIGGRGRQRYEDDPTGYFDSQSLWSTTDGKIMPALQWRFARGIRNCETFLPSEGSTMAWWKLYGNDPTNKIARCLSMPFAASGSYSVDKGYLWIRRRGTPGTLTFELCADNSGSPGTVLQTVTKTTTNITDTVSIYQVFDWTGVQALTGTTTYHVKVYGGAGDTSSNHWEVLCATGYTTSKYSPDNSAWTTSIVAMYYRIVDVDIARKWLFFQLEGLLYAVSQNDDGTTSLLKNNGVRGTVTSATANTLTCSGLSMTTSQYVSSVNPVYIRIYDGTGDGQIRKITANTGTQFTFSANWSITPDTTSRFVMYSTDTWNVTTGTPALTAIKNKPVVTNGIAYLPQGQGVNLKRMRVNVNSHDFADDGTNKTDLMLYSVEGVTPLVYTVNANSATLQTASAPAWGSNLTLGSAKNIGGTEYRITNLFSHNKVVYVFKENGLYTYNNGLAEQLGGGFADNPDNNTGIGVAEQSNYLWFGWYHSLERMVGSSVDDMLNFKNGYDGLPSDRTGYVSSIVSAVGWLFFAVNGLGNNYSSIMCWNGMGFHEIFRGWDTGVQIRSMFWQPCISNRGRLWFDVGGDMAFIEFPLYASNPLKDTSINYQHEGVIVTSTYDAHDQNLYKILGLLRVFSDSGSAEIDYQTNANVGTNNWTVLGTADAQPVKDLTLNLGGVFQVRFRLRLQTTTSTSPTVLTGWQLSGRMAALKKYQYLATFKTDSDQTTFTDEPDTDPNTLYSQLQTWAEQQTKLVMRTQTSSSDNKNVTISLPSKSVDWIDSGESKWGGRISTALLET